MNDNLTCNIENAIKRRDRDMDISYKTAFRLINGFIEGVPGLVFEVFGKTLVCHDYTEEFVISDDSELSLIIKVICNKLSWIEAVIVKKRRSKDAAERNGVLVYGSKIDNKIRENGIWYALDLTMNQDASFYLDTRDLRKWLFEHLGGKSVLNTFAYTGSLGIASLAGGAEMVMQLDLNKKFLNIAKRSAELNGKSVKKYLYQTGDFWTKINQYKKNRQMFDCVILDPPVYAKTNKGTIDLAKNYDKIINKVRPVINHNGYLVTVNNALFQNGQDHKDCLDKLCESGFLKIESIISVPDDCVGDVDNVKNCLPQDPFPYNHSTKITVLRVFKKQC